MTKLIRSAFVMCALILLFGYPSYAQEAGGERQVKPVTGIEDNGILVFKTADDSFKWWVDGRVMIDSAAYLKSDNQLANGTELRRVRAGFNMVLWKTWTSQFDVDLVDNAVDLKDMWIAYNGWVIDRPLHRNGTSGLVYRPL